MSFIINAFRFAAAVVGWYSMADGANADIVDTPNIQSGGSFTIPAAWDGRRVRVSANGQGGGDLYSAKGGSSYMGAARTTIDVTASSHAFGHAFSAPITVVTGEVFTFTGRGSDANSSWGSVELLKSGMKGALVKRSGTMTVNTTSTELLWNAEEYKDDSSMHDNSTNPGRLIVQSGTTGLVRLTCSIQVDTSGGQIYLELRKNGTQVAYLCPSVDTVGEYVSLISPPIAVVANDYFTVHALTSSSSNLQAGNYSWFAMEELESGLNYAIAGRSSNGTTGTAGSDRQQALNNEAVDVGSWFTSGNAYFTVPSGLTAVRMGGWGTHGASTTGYWKMWMAKTSSGTNFPGMGAHATDNSGTDNSHFASGIVACTAGDEYYCYIRAGAGSQYLATGGTYWIEEAKDYT
jgi:hypothetical protein